MSETNLMQASHQWANRPADERFETLEDLYLNSFVAAQNAKTANTLLGNVEAVPQGDDIKLKTTAGLMGFNNWSFSQFGNRTGTRSGSVNDLPVQLAVDTLNHRIKREGKLEMQIYFDEPTMMIRAATSQSYARILNHEVVRAIIELPGKWVTPPARPAMAGQPGSRIATEKDIVGGSHPDLGIKVGDWIAPAGLYGSDRDMFAFLVDPDTEIEDGTDMGLRRGFFVRNSEVGNASFELVTFFYRYVCGNHIVWGASKVERVNIRHMGKQAKERAFEKMRTALKLYREASAADDVLMIKKMRVTELGGTYQELHDTIFNQRALSQLLRQSDVKDAYDIANEHADIDGSPRSVWGFAQGMTRLSQKSPFADHRTKLDRAAGKILDLVGAE